MSTIAATGNATAMTANASGSSGLAENFETFLTLLTTQLQNQDPLSPMDTDKFTSQLVQFAAVEQQLKTNAGLTSLVSLTKAATAGTALSFLGAEVTVDGSRVAVDASGGTAYYSLGGEAQEAVATVFDAAGKVVHTASVPAGSGEKAWGWNGKDGQGKSVAAGIYRVEIRAVDQNGALVPVSTSRSGTVASVDTTGSTPRLMVGGIAVPLEAISDITQRAA